MATNLIAESQQRTVVKAFYSPFTASHDLANFRAVEEVGAHVEYRYQRGDLAAVNLQEIAREEYPAIEFGVR